MSNQTLPHSTRPFGWRDKIGYMFGDFGNDFTFILQMMFFMAFYTDIMGVEAVHVGYLLLFARLLDAFTDVGIGRLVDTLQPSSQGRFRPWLLRGALPVAICSALMYMPFVAHAAYGVRIVYMVITYVLWGSVAYTIINIPYGSMAAVVSNRPEHRSSLSVFRSMGAMLAFLLISAVLPNIVNVDNKLDGTRMMWAAIVCAICAVICYVICYVNVEERIVSKPKSKAEQPSFAMMLSTLGRNRPLIALVAGAIVFLIGSQVASTVTVYLWKDYFARFDMMTVAQIVSIAPVFVLAMFATWLATTVGKKEMIAWGLAASGILCILGWALHIKNVWVFITLFFLISLGVGIYNVLIWALITDVLDFQEVNTGNRDDATIYAIYSWARKLGQAVAGFIVGWAVSTIGYSAELAKAKKPQAPEVLDGIYLLFMLIPGVLYLITGAIMGWWYPLTRDKVTENFHILQERANAQQKTVY